MSAMASIHQFKAEGIGGNEIDFSDFKGKKIMVVNVASECGYTPQYQQLQEIYDEFKDKLVIVGFPSNDFGMQEPGSNAEIKTFCSLKYRVTFPLAAKISIKGNNNHPIFKWLTKKEANNKFDSEVEWNFYKYLLDENGQLVDFYPSAVNPLDERIINWILS